ncbi:MAG: hypothetical protein ACREL6_06685, partial [Gemmatimonadales bacterium]
MTRAFPFLLALLVTAPLAAQTAMSEWSTSDRTIIGDFTRITSVAAARDRVYATSPSAVLMWNPWFRRWEGTAVPPDPAMLDRVFASLVDPLDNTLWLARIDGWVHYDPFIQLWETGVVNGPVQEIAFDLAAPFNGLHLRTPSGWVMIPRGTNAAVPGLAPAQPVQPASVRQAIQANPTLQANSAAILLDNRLRSARYTSAARSFEGLGWYLGTWGVGLLYIPDGAALPDQLTYGLPGEEVDALYSAPNGVWVTTARSPSTDPGIAFVASELNDFRWFRGPTAIGLPFGRSSEIVARRRDLWIGTDAGVAAVDVESGEVTLYDEGHGLPDNRVLSVATRQGRLVFGTARGVAVLDSGEVRRVAPGFVDPALALALTGDTIWVGTRRGILTILPGEDDAVVMPELQSAASLRLGASAFAWQADTLVAMSEDRLLWRKPETGTWFLGPLLSPLLGQLRAMTADQEGLWIAGDRGLAHTTATMAPSRILDIPLDTNGEVRALAADEVYLWVGTENGLTR